MYSLFNYVEKNQREMLALIRAVDRPAWEVFSTLSRTSQVAAISTHPKVRESAVNHVLREMGFGPMDSVQHRFTRKMYVVDYPLVGFSDDGVPLKVVLFGHEFTATHEAPSTSFIGHIGDFSSLSTGASITAEELLKVGRPATS